MRKQTLIGVSFILAIVIVYLFNSLARAQGIKLPFIGFVSPMIASFIVAPLLILPLTLINQRILAWRKARGRDIEEEERYEIEGADIISLRPKPPEKEDDDPIEYR